MSRFSRLFRFLITALTVTILAASVVLLPGAAGSVEGLPLPNDPLRSLCPGPVVSGGRVDRSHPADRVCLGCGDRCHAVPTPGGSRHHPGHEQYPREPPCVSPIPAPPGIMRISPTAPTNGWSEPMSAGSRWGYSSWQPFTVSYPVPATGFFSPFTTDAVGWAVHSGVWNCKFTELPDHLRCCRCQPWLHCHHQSHGGLLHPHL